MWLFYVIKLKHAYYPTPTKALSTYVVGACDCLMLCSLT